MHFLQARRFVFRGLAATSSPLPFNYVGLASPLPARLWLTLLATFMSALSSTTALPMVAVLSPTNGATHICYDTPLYITFNQPPLTRNAGTIKIYNSTNPATPVDTLDMSLNVTRTQTGTGIAPFPVNVQPRTIAGAFYTNFPVIITGNTAAIYPHSGVMKSNQTYYVTVDNGVFTDTNAVYFSGITDSNAWRFTTKGTPSVGTNFVIVAGDGSGDFCTVQGAVDFLPPATLSTNRTIYLRKGIYTEIVNVPAGKNNITFRGESRQESLLAYLNDVIINNSSHQVMVLHVRANDIAIENLKLTNSVPQGGSQGFALMVETGAKRFICNNAEVDSYQDTILVNDTGTTAYFYKSLIQGDVDFIWGGGNCFFTNCELKELRTGGIYFQPRTTPGSNGMSVVRCNFTRFNGTNASGSNFTNCLFARALSKTNSNVALICCNIDTNIVQTGWTVADITNPALALRWWEFGNSNLAGTAAVSYNGIQLTNGDSRLVAAKHATTWLSGWVPQLQPNILTNPTSAFVSYNAAATFTVSATGIPEPTYQWQKSGTNVPGATNGSLVFTNVKSGDAGGYSAVVSNFGGAVTSSIATLTYAGQIYTDPLTTSTNASMKFIGVPGFFYSTERSTNLVNVIGWVCISTNVADTNGLFQVIDRFGDLGITPPPIPPAAFYRLHSNP
jgi:pectin methylesterase-like acyl-CoA thioesterase